MPVYGKFLEFKLPSVSKGGRLIIQQLPCFVRSGALVTVISVNHAAALSEWLIPIYR